MIPERKGGRASHLNHRELLTRASQGWLLSGYVSETQFWLLVGISSMHSEKVINALLEYLVLGIPRKEACEKYRVNSGHFSIGLNRLQHISHAAAKLAEHYKP